MRGRHSMQKILSSRHWRGGTTGQRHFTVLLKEEHDLNTVISGWTGEGAEKEQLVAENKVAEYQDRWRWKENFPGVVQ